MVTSLDAPIYLGGVYSVDPLELHQHRVFKVSEHENGEVLSALENNVTIPKDRSPYLL